MPPVLKWNVRLLSARRATEIETAEAAGHAAGEWIGAAAGIGRWWGMPAPEDVLKPELIVLFPLRWVRQDLVRLRALLEFLGGIWVILILIGVPRQCSFPGRTQLG